MESIKILLLEDSPHDVELITECLRKDSQEYKIKVVETGEEFNLELEAFRPDIILADYHLPQFSGSFALAIVRKKYPEIPFIFVTGAIGEEKAIETLHKGATDFILKNNLSRLPQVVARAYKEKKLIHESHLLSRDLKQNKIRYSALVENFPTGVFRLDLTPPGRFVEANPALAHIYGFSKVSDLLITPIEELYADSSEYISLVEEIQSKGRVKNREIWIKKQSGEKTIGSITAVCLRNKKGLPVWIDGTLEDVSEKKEAIDALQRRTEELDLILRSIGSLIIGVSLKDHITHWNRFAESTLGIEASDIIGKKMVESGIDWDWERIYEAITNCIINDEPVRLDDVKYRKKEGCERVLGLSVNPLKARGDILEGFIIIGRDLTEKRMLEAQLHQARKLEAVGQLAAGISHEINTPIQYVGDNLVFIKNSIKDINKMFDFLSDAIESGNVAELLNSRTGQLKKIMDDIDFIYLMKELPKAVEQSLGGIEKVSQIIKSMKAFAHPGSESKSPADINLIIENTVVISRNEWKYDCDFEFHPDYSLPGIPCFQAELGQVILNLIVNAVDSIQEARKKGMIERGLISITTSPEKEYAVIQIKDNGIGIPEEIRDKIFNLFFTTKEVGKGSGQGLPISHSIVVDKHGGVFNFITETGRGSTFFIKLPMH